MAAPRKRPPTTKAEGLPEGVRVGAYDKNGNVYSYQGRLEGPPVLVDGKPKRGQLTENFALKDYRDRWQDAVAAAVTWRTTTAEKLEQGLHHGKDHREPLIDYATGYVERRYRNNDRYRAKQLDVIRTTLANHPLGLVPLCEVKSDAVTDWLYDIRESRGLKDSTLRSRRYFLSAVYHHAIVTGLLGFNPVLGSWCPKKPARRKVPVLTGAQVVRIAAGLIPRKRAIVIIQAALGVRIGEVLGIREGDLLEVPYPAVRVETQLAIGGGRSNVKTGDEGHRDIPLDPFAKAILDAHMDKWPPLESTDPDVDGLIFYRPFRGVQGPYHKRGMGELHRIFARLHADDPTFPLLPEGVLTHVFRYHYASQMAPELGGDTALVAELMGHTDTGMLTDVYLLPRPDQGARVIDASTRRWGTVRNDPGGSGAPRGLAVDS